MRTGPIFTSTTQMEIGSTEMDGSLRRRSRKRIYRYGGRREQGGCMTGP